MRREHVTVRLEETVARDENLERPKHSDNVDITDLSNQAIKGSSDVEITD